MISGLLSDVLALVGGITGDVGAFLVDLVSSLGL